MSSYQDCIALSTHGHRDMHDLTEPVTRIVDASGIETGLAHVHTVGSTGAVGTIEFEPGLQRDLRGAVRDCPTGSRVRPRAALARRYRFVFEFEKIFWRRERDRASRTQI